jgi:hypothetical protein
MTSNVAWATPCYDFSKRKKWSIILNLVGSTHGIWRHTGVLARSGKKANPKKRYYDESLDNALVEEQNLVIRSCHLLTWGLTHRVFTTVKPRQAQGMNPQSIQFHVIPKALTDWVSAWPVSRKIRKRAWAEALNFVEPKSFVHQASGGCNKWGKSRHKGPPP